VVAVQIKHTHLALGRWFKVVNVGHGAAGGEPLCYTCASEIEYSAARCSGTEGTAARQISLYTNITHQHRTQCVISTGPVGRLQLALCAVLLLAQLYRCGILVQQQPNIKPVLMISIFDQHLRWRRRHAAKHRCCPSVAPHLLPSARQLLGTSSRCNHNNNA
jgi:hypothetical protein